MTVRRSARALLLFILVGQLTAIDVLGWGPLAHYTIGQAAAVGVTGIPRLNYHSLPDSWYPPWSRTFSITEWFAWSHAVQRTGRNLWDLTPRVPIYGPASPGESMYQRCNSQATCSEAAKATALGFLAHDAEDGEVHWTFSPGGRFQAWKEHVVKEEWAECVVYEKILAGTYIRGKATLPQVGNGGDSRMIRLAQQDFNNSTDPQATLDRGRRTKLSGIQSEAEIERLIQEHATRIARDLQRINASSCAELVERAVGKWSDADVERLYREAVVAVRKIYVDHPF